VAGKADESLDLGGDEPLGPVVAVAVRLDSVSRIRFLHGILGQAVLQGRPRRPSRKHADCNEVIGTDRAPEHCLGYGRLAPGLFGEELSEGGV
jgi:hypothetical protein